MYTEFQVNINAQQIHAINSPSKARYCSVCLGPRLGHPRTRCAYASPPLTPPTIIGVRTDNPTMNQFKRIQEQAVCRDTITERIVRWREGIPSTNSLQVDDAAFAEVREYADLRLMDGWAELQAELQEPPTKPMTLEEREALLTELAEVTTAMGASVLVLREGDLLCMQRAAGQLGMMARAYVPEPEHQWGRVKQGLLVVGWDVPEVEAFLQETCNALERDGFQYTAARIRYSAPLLAAHRW